MEITRRLGSGRISGSNWRVLDANKAVPPNYNKSEPLLDLATNRSRATSLGSLTGRKESIPILLYLLEERVVDQIVSLARPVALFENE